MDRPTGMIGPARLRDVILDRPRPVGRYTADQVATARYVLTCLADDVDVRTAPLLWETFNVLIDALTLELAELGGDAA